MFDYQGDGRIRVPAPPIHVAWVGAAAAQSSNPCTAYVKGVKGHAMMNNAFKYLKVYNRKLCVRMSIYLLLIRVAFFSSFFSRRDSSFAAAAETGCDGHELDGDRQ